MLCFTSWVPLSHSSHLFEIMSHNLLGRLPPLQAIGRSKCVDLDDPPAPVDDDDDDAEDLVDSYLKSLEKDSDQRPPSYRFNVEHAAAASTTFAVGFKVLRPGDHYCKKADAQVTGFTHCEKSVSMALKHRELDRLLANRVQLEFTKDLLSRINEFALFVGELQQLVKEESRVWYQICRDELSSAPTTRLEQLCALCEDLRMQLNQWNSIKQSMHSNRHLRSLLPSLCSSVTIVRRRLIEMSESAIFWLNRLILIGSKVLAHCDLERIGQDALWNIARGLEEYNMIVGVAQITHPTHHVENICNFFFPLTADGSVSNVSRGISRQSTDVMSLIDVLKLIANERAKYAAASAKVYFTGSKEFLALIKDAYLPRYTWSLKVSPSRDHFGASNSSQLPNCSAANTRSHCQLSTSLHVTDSIFAPDLSSEISPLVDFVRRESTFVGHFLQIVCHSTSLIKKQSNNQLPADVGDVPANPRTNVSRLKKLRLKTIALSSKAQPENQNAGFDAEPEAAEQAAEPVSNQDHSESRLTKADPTRKCVSWGDSSLAVSIQQVTQEYLRLLWSRFADHIFNFLVSAELGNAKDAKDRFGRIALCPNTFAMIIKTMIENASVGDTFPLGCRLSLASVSLRLHMSVAMAAWDGALSAALANATADKCQPTQLTTDVYSTTTGMLLRDAYQPLYSILLNLVRLSDMSSSDGSTAVIWKDVISCGAFLSVLKRLKSTADLCFLWCNDRTLQFVASKSVSHFLLVAFSDLPMLTDENNRAFQMCQLLYDGLMMLSSAAPDRNTVWRIGELWKMLNESHCHLQALVSSCQKQYHQLCLSSSRDFFHNEMPSGKEWKRKSSEALPVQHMEYIERAMDSLLEPIASGISRLHPTARFDVLSTALANVCDAWTSNILNKKIRFSYHGACQLELDVLYLKTWMASYISDAQLCHHLISLDFIQYLDCVVLLLKQQPTGHQGRRSSSRVRQQPPVANAEKGFKGAGTDGTQSISNASMCTPSSDTTEDSKNGISWDSKTTSAERSLRSCVAMGNSASLEETESEGHAIPHKEQWLALRVHGGTRNWPKFSSCFNNMNA